VLVGRAEELDRLGALLDEARLGHAGAVTLAGDAGIGKTSLLDETAALAGDFTVLRARGIESEGALSYAVLLELLGGTTSLLDALPAHLREALEAACALRPGRGDPAVVAAAWTTLLTTLADQRPVLVMVDDVQWIDGATAAAVLFAARRVRDARVATLLAVREPHYASRPLDGIERLELRRLDGEASRLLAGDASSEAIATAAGNPLALVELARAGAGRWAGTVAERLFGGRVEQLSISGRRALLAAALDTSGRAEVIVAVSGGAEPLDELRRHGLVDIQDDRLELRHPLVRTLMLAVASSDERRSLHAALAAILPQGAERTRHRALAATTPNAELADEVETLATRTSGRANNAWALERAADLTPRGERRARRLLAAARASFDVRDMAAAQRLVRRAREEDEAATKSGVRELVARLALADGAQADAARALRAVAAEVADGEPTRAVRLFVSAAYVLSVCGHGDEALEVAEDASALVDGDHVLELLVSSARAEAVAAGGGFVRAQRMFRELAATGELQSVVHADREARLVLVEAFYSGAQLDRARQLAIAAQRDARADGALGELQLALACLFSIEFTAGRFDAADTAASEELELASGFGRAMERREALGHLAWCDAVKGRAEACRAHAAERLALSAAVGVNTTPHPAPGLLDLGLGNFGAAADTLRALEASHSRSGRVAAESWRPCTADLIEALVRADREEEARAILDGFEREARASNRPLALALAQRARGLVADDDSFDAAFQASLELDAEEPSPFERARTELCWGERLRRVRRRAEARVPLRQARDAFERSGATLWLARADSELSATGERVRRRSSGSGLQLTPQERRVAALVSEGLTNRDVAARLFVSTNTIETHLRHLFQKFGVASRTELAARFRDLRDSNDVASF
jgi:DNA-binding CsgD family transcriptional regulator